MRGESEFWLIVPRHPAKPREFAGLAEGLHSESRGIGAEVVSCRASPRQSGANRSSRPTSPSATGPVGAHHTPAAGNNFTADSTTIRSVARAYDGLAAHLPRRQRPKCRNPAPSAPCHPPLGDSTHPTADRLPDRHAAAAPDHPRAGREPRFELWHWPQHQPLRCRSAEISVSLRPSCSIDVSHAVKSCLNPACALNDGPQRSRRYLSHSDK